MKKNIVDYYWVRYGVYMLIVAFFGILGNTGSQILVAFGLLLGEINYCTGKFK